MIALQVPAGRLARRHAAFFPRIPPTAIVYPGEIARQCLRGDVDRDYTQVAAGQYREGKELWADISVAVETENRYTAPVALNFRRSSDDPVLCQSNCHHIVIRYRTWLNIPQVNHRTNYLTAAGICTILYGKDGEMPKQELMTETINVSEARKHFSGLVNEVAGRKKRVLVEKSGAPVAAIVSADDLRRLQEFEAQRERDFAVLEELQEAFADVPTEELEREVAKALAEVRAEMRAEQAAREVVSSTQ